MARRQLKQPVNVSDYYTPRPSFDASTLPPSSPFGLFTFSPQDYLSTYTDIRSVFKRGQPPPPSLPPVSYTGPYGTDDLDWDGAPGRKGNSVLWSSIRTRQSIDSQRTGDSMDLAPRPSTSSDQSTWTFVSKSSSIQSDAATPPSKRSSLVSRFSKKIRWKSKKS